ncbi:MAG: DUF427 domain-containing protein [Halieaceae bacterium]|nr:DUF427 domain-containing protein [Halieaceae bacterium]
MFEYRGQHRPAFAEEPGDNQESVWDYPRPPALEASSDEVEVRAGDALLAKTRSAFRVLETASPPTYYLPAEAVSWELLSDIAQSSFCEWKGQASYYALAGDEQRRAIAWRYRNPSQRFAALHDHVSFYPGRVACFVNGERVRPQAGEFYGGWITDRIVGPFKGDPGTGHW